MNCYEKFATPEITHWGGGDYYGYTQMQFYCDRVHKAFRFYYDDDHTIDPKADIPGLIQRALSVCYQCPLAQRIPDNENNAHKEF